MRNKTKEEFYNYGKSLGISINNLQRLRMIGNEDIGILNTRILELEAQVNSVSCKENKWISVNDRLPKLKVVAGELITTVENSHECIVSDGITSWIDYYCLDGGFHKSITKWRPIPKP